MLSTRGVRILVNVANTNPIWIDLTLKTTISKGVVMMIMTYAKDTPYHDQHLKNMLLLFIMEVFDYLHQQIDFLKTHVLIWHNQLKALKALLNFTSISLVKGGCNLAKSPNFIHLEPSHHHQWNLFQAWHSFMILFVQFALCN